MGRNEDAFLLKFSDPTNPEPPTVDAGPDYEICAGDSVRLSAAISPAGDYRVLWTPAEGLDDPSSLSPTAAPAQTTQYVVAVLGTAPPVTDTVRVVVRQGPAIQSLEVVPVHCAAGAIRIRLTGGEPPYRVLVNGTLRSVEPEPTFALTIEEAGKYALSIEDAGGCAATQADFEVEVPAVSPLRFWFLAYSPHGEAGEADRSIIVRAVRGVPPVEYAIEGRPYQPTGVFRGLQTGTYTLYARDSLGCVIERRFELR